MNSGLLPWPSGYKTSQVPQSDGKGTQFFNTAQFALRLGSNVPSMNWGNNRDFFTLKTMWKGITTHVDS